jgi:NADH-quinone oxidoreductase subunit N
MFVSSEGFLPEFAPGSAEIFIGLSLLMFLVIGAFRGDSYTRTLGYLCIVVALMTVFIISFADKNTGIFFNGLFIRNSFTSFCKITILLTVSCVLWMTLRSLERENMARFEYPLLVLFSALGMLIMVSANDLMSMYLGLELQSFSLYILVALKRDRLIAAEGALKYFILGALASAFILYGSSFLYGLTGSTEFSSLFSVFKDPALTSSPPLVMGILLILGGLAFKLALVPFHMWSPDVYEGSPTPVTVLIATAPKIAAFALFIKLFVHMIGDLNIIWEQAVVILSVLSIALGAFAALFQNNIKRLLSYSAISHMGYALFGLLGKTYEGIGSILVYLVLYIIMTLGCFACLLNLRKNSKTIEKLSDFSGLSHDNPVLALSFAIFLFSLAGIPPFSGFFAKLGVFSIAIKEGYYTLAVFGVIGTVISAAYYLKIIKIMYFEGSLSFDIKNHFDRYVFRETYIVMSIMAFITFFYVLKPSLLSNAAHTAAFALFN